MMSQCLPRIKDYLLIPIVQAQVGDKNALGCDSSKRDMIFGFNNVKY